jgi:hypothetical protein
MGTYRKFLHIEFYMNNKQKEGKRAWEIEQEG